MIFRMEEWLKHDVSRSVDASLKDDLCVHIVQMFGVLERRFDQLLEVHKDLDVVLCIFMYHNSLQFLDKEHSNTIENKKRKKKISRVLMKNPAENDRFHDPKVSKVGMPKSVRSQYLLRQIFWRAPTAQWPGAKCPWHSSQHQSERPQSSKFSHRPWSCCL